MADANTELDLDPLHQAIRDQIAAQFPSFKTVEFYRDDEDQAIPAPACLLEMDDFEPAQGEDAGTGQLVGYARFCARVIIGIRTPQAKLAVRKSACALAAWLHSRHWGAGIAAGNCQVIAVSPDEFDPGLDKWAVWRVEWRQLIMLGETAWTNDGTIPESLFSWAPDIGLGHEADYQPANPE